MNSEQIKKEYQDNKKEILRLQKKNADIIAKHPDIENPDAALDMRTPEQKEQIRKIMTPRPETPNRHY